MIQMLANNHFFLKVRSVLSTSCGRHTVTPFQNVQYGKGWGGNDFTMKK